MLGNLNPNLCQRLCPPIGLNVKIILNYITREQNKEVNKNIAPKNKELETDRKMNEKES